MDITPLIAAGSNIINSYNDESFTINNVKYLENIIISRNHLAIWHINTEQIDDPANFQILYDLVLDAEILLIGIGPYYKNNINFLRKKIKNFFVDINPNLSVELMTTGAACRTYNIILSESRKIVACLIPAAK